MTIPKSVLVTTNSVTRTIAIPAPRLEANGREGIRLEIGGYIGRISTPAVYLTKEKGTKTVKLAGFTAQWLEAYGIYRYRTETIADGFRSFKAALEWLQIELDYSAT